MGVPEHPPPRGEPNSPPRHYMVKSDEELHQDESQESTDINSFSLNNIQISGKRLSLNNLRPEDLSATSASSRESDFLGSTIDIKREGQISSSVSLSEAKPELNSNLKAEEERGTAISKCKSATKSARKCNL